MFHIRRRTKRLIALGLAAGVCVVAVAFQVPQKASAAINSFLSETQKEIDQYKEVFNIHENINLPTIPTGSGGEMEVHFIDMGNADSILLICDGEAALVDAGENNQGDEVVAYIEEQGVESLKYAFGTHPHSDHIGGLDTVLSSVGTGTVFMPNKAHTTATYEDVLEVIEQNDIPLKNPQRGDSYSLGGATIKVMSADLDWGDELNDYSIVLLVENGEDSFVLTGDAEVAVEEEILEDGTFFTDDNEDFVDVLKIGHHGSSTSSSQRWLRALMPKYCVIPCGEGNEYGHPHNEVMSRLDDLAEVNGTITYRNDLNGTVIAYSDGSDNIRIETER